MNAVRRIESGQVEVYKQLRLAALKDAPEAFATTYESARSRRDESWRTQVEEAANGKDRAIFIVYDNDQPVGLAGLYRDDKESHVGELIQVWVSPAFRGGPIAGQLIEAVATWARMEKFKTIKALVKKESYRALSFYRKCGFTQITADPGLAEQEFALELFTATATPDSAR